MGISVGVSVGAIVLFIVIAIIVCVVGGVMAAVLLSRRSHAGSNSTTYSQMTHPQSYTVHSHTGLSSITCSQTTHPQCYTTAGIYTTNKRALLPAYTAQATDAYPTQYPSQPQNTYPPQEI